MTRGKWQRKCLIKSIKTPFSCGWEMWIISLTRPSKSFPVQGGHSSTSLRICHMAPWASEVEPSPSPAEFSTQGAGVGELMLFQCVQRDTSERSSLPPICSLVTSIISIPNIVISASSSTLVFLPLSLSLFFPSVDGVSLTLMLAWARGVLAATLVSHTAVLMRPFTHGSSVYRGGTYVHKVRAFIRTWDGPLVAEETVCHLICSPTSPNQFNIFASPSSAD